MPALTAGIMLLAAAACGTTQEASRETTDVGSTTPVASTIKPARPEAVTTSPTVSPQSNPSTVSSSPAGDVERQRLDESTEHEPTPPGSYVTDVLPVELVLDTEEPLVVPFHEDGKVVLTEPGHGDDFVGVQFHVVDSFVDTNLERVPVGRLAPDADLDSWLSIHPTVDLVTGGSGQIGGVPGQWWHITSPDGCERCWTPLLMSQGWANAWGIPSGYSMTLWMLDTPSPLAVVIEAPTDEYARWESDAGALLDDVRFGDPTGHSIARPRGDAVGDYAVGRAEAVVADSSRRTLESSVDGSVAVEAGGERRLLLSVSYPSVDGGFGATVAPGTFPVVIVAPALWDAGASLPQDRVLASHGYVVVNVRFPESSWPGGNVAGVPHQPADVSFTLSAVLDGALGDEITHAIDPERVALVGNSAGATTAYGLLRSACCVDDRFDAVIAHGGTPYDFASEPAAAVAPVLHVASTSDTTAPVAPIEQLHNSIEGSSTLAVYDDVAHLEWLDPESAAFADVVELSLGFLDRHLNGSAVDLPAASVMAVTLDER